MELERGRDEEDAGILAAERDAGEVAEAFEIAGVEVAADAHPVIERLKGQLEVHGRLQFEDGEATVVIDSEEVGDAAVAAVEDGHLTIEGSGAEGGVDGGGVRTDLGFEPAFGVLEVERV